MGLMKGLASRLTSSPKTFFQSRMLFAARLFQCVQRGYLKRGTKAHQRSPSTPVT